MKKNVLLFMVMLFTILPAQGRVVKYQLPQGDLKWSTKRPKSAKMCVPAAFTSESGKVIGSYRCNGRSYRTSEKMKVSLKGNTFYLNRYWTSNNGFEQLTLVYNSKPVKFKSQAKAVRRALCKNNTKTFLIQSLYPMTLSEFARECCKHSTYAVYLDMGEYGYGYIENHGIKQPLFVFGILTQYKQTNWLYIE